MTNIKHILKLAAVAGALALASAGPRAERVSRRPKRRPTRWSTASRGTTAMRSRRWSDPTTANTFPPASVDPEDVTNFLAAWAQAHAIVPAGADKAFLGAGKNGWTLPIPIVKTAAGWRFDTAAAPEEMRMRRIGRNELAAIQVALAYTDAQNEYHARDWNGDGVLNTRRAVCRRRASATGCTGRRCPASRKARSVRSSPTRSRGQPYHGYLYKILTAQGKDAPGGARSYIKNGRMTEGYALVAWPAVYGDTGVMTFIVNQDGVVYQKNLGADTGAAARALNAYDPDASWTKVAPGK